MEGGEKGLKVHGRPGEALEESSRKARRTLKVHGRSGEALKESLWKVKRSPEREFVEGQEKP